MEKRQLTEDFKDFIRYLNLNNVEYLLVGGLFKGKAQIINEMSKLPIISTNDYC